MSSQARAISSAVPQTASQTESSGSSASLLLAAEKVLDLATVMGTVLAAEAADRKLQLDSHAHYPWSVAVLAAAGFALLFVLLVERRGGYQSCVSLLAIRETERTLQVTLQSFSVALVIAYLCGIPVLRVGFAIALLAVPLVLTLEKWETRKILRALRSRGYGVRRALILGTGSIARRIYTALVNSPLLGIEPVAFVDDSEGSPSQIYECSYHREHSARVVAGPLCPELFRQFGATVLVVADALIDRTTLQSATPSADAVSTYFAAQDTLETGNWLDYTEIDDIVLAHVARPPQRVVGDLAKRMLDIVAAALSLLILAPIMLAIAIAVRATSPGTALFRQQRVGKDGRLFSICKFRTMYRDAPQYGYSPVAGEDPRVTPLGRFLRRTSLDEVPQLINVLLGEMSLVGPRPEMPFLVEQYSPLQRRRLTVKPGLTGLWQISADRAFLIHENIEYDLYFIPDCVEGLLRLMASNHREPLNLGTEEMVSVDELVDLVCEVAGKKLTKHHHLDRPQGVRGRNSDNSRLRQVLGYEPKTPLRQGLAVTYRWIESELRNAGRLESTLAHATV